MVACCAAAPSPPVVPFVGANVDAGVLLPGQPNFIATSQGDLFDIARKAGLGAFRVTDFETWGPGERDTPYTAQEWEALGTRALATHVALVPVLELSLPDRRVVAAASDRERAFIEREERMADVVLGDAGLAKRGAVAAVDLGNEPELGPASLEIARAVGAYVRARYANVPVTVGGWKVPLGEPGQRPWRWNAAADGAPLLPLEDVVEPHVYNVPAPGDAPGSSGTRGLADEPVSRLPAEVERYVRTVRGWSGNEPILIGEFGMPNGLGSRSHLAPATVADPDAQSAHIAATLAGVRAARATGANVEGALLWILAPRGGPERSQSEDNAWTLIVPQGHGKPLRVLPGLVALCAGFGATCDGARDLVAHPPVER